MTQQQNSPNWRKIVDNLTDRITSLVVEHAAMKSLASDYEESAKFWQERAENAEAQLGGVAKEGDHGHGHGHESVEYRSVQAADEAN